MQKSCGLHALHQTETESPHAVPKLLRWSMKVGDIVLVESFAGPRVHVQLQKRIVKQKNGWGANGWDGTVIYKDDVEKLIAAGVPHKKEIQPVVFVFDNDIIEVINERR